MIPFTQKTDTCQEVFGHLTGQLNFSSKPKYYVTKNTKKRQCLWTIISHYTGNQIIGWLCHSKRHDFSHYLK